MHARVRSILLIAALWMSGSTGSAQQRLTDNTLKLEPGRQSPPATIAEMGWLAGHWLGEALGGVSEEIWSPARDGAMMGMYRLIRDGKTAFYELLTLKEEAGSLILRLKHFNPDLSGWEEKDKSVDFRLVALREEMIYFEGLTFRRGPDEMTIYLAFKQRDGTYREEKLHHKRVSGGERPGG